MLTRKHGYCHPVAFGGRVVRSLSISVFNCLDRRQEKKAALLCSSPTYIKQHKRETFFTFCGNQCHITPGQGAITGPYFTSFGNHGFLRAPDGTFTTFDAPGAVFGTRPSSINPAGAITGSYTDASFGGHGFLRAPDGAFTTFDPPGSAGTIPQSINPAGAITGGYEEASFGVHGFLRAPDGTFTTFDLPGSIFTGPQSINPAGAIMGHYQDASFKVHGFLRSP